MTGYDTQGNLKRMVDNHPSSNTPVAQNLRARGYELVGSLEDEYPYDTVEGVTRATHDVRGHFPFDGYEHPADHTHQDTPSRPGWVGVQVSITVQVNLASWEANYGGDRPQDIPGMVREDARGAVEENLARRGITAVVR